jgi:hypothetical protein
MQFFVYLNIATVAAWSRRFEDTVVATSGRHGGVNPPLRSVAGMC